MSVDPLQFLLPYVQILLDASLLRALFLEPILVLRLITTNEMFE